MKQELLTAGEFAKLACTTKRTVQYYDQMGILKPFKVDTSGYRYYRQKQILDFQVILLLRALKFPIRDIKKYLGKNKSLKELFLAKRSEVEGELKYLRYTLKSLDKFFGNLERNRTLVMPEIKQVKPFSIYYIEKVGAYSQIGGFCTELRDMFKRIPEGTATIAIFEGEGYQPKKEEMKIAMFKKRGMVVKRDFEDIVKTGRVAGFKALTYIHNGSGAILSLFWQETYKYMKQRNFKRDYKRNELEIYWKVSEKPYEQFFEIFIPIL